MNRNLVAGRSARWLGLFGALGLALAVGCGDSESDGDGNNGGNSGNGGKAGSSNGGSSGSGGSSSGGSAAVSGDAGEGGVGGDAGEGNEGGDSGGDAGGAGGASVTFWDDGDQFVGTADDANAFRGVAWEDNDTLYVAGYLEVADGDHAIAVAKFNVTTEGELELDDNYGDNGIASHNVIDKETENVTAETARGLVIQDGKVVISGLIEADAGAVPASQGRDVVVLRFDANGDLDTTFAPDDGTDGELIWDIGSSISKADDNWGLAIDDDDKLVIFASGENTSGDDRNRFVARLEADGDFDDTFNPGGVFEFDATGEEDDDNTRYGLIEGNGDIFVAGYTPVVGRNQIVLQRLNGDGTPDTDFADVAADLDGWVRFAPFAFGMAEAYGAAVQSDGSYVTTGYGRQAASGPVDLVSFRISSTGAFDSTWGSNGTFLYDHLGSSATGTDDRGRHLAVLPDDRIIMAGCAAVGINTVAEPDSAIEDAMLLLLDADGNMASDFDEEGVKLWNVDDGTDEEFYSVAVSPDGKYVAAAGYSTATQAKGLLVLLPIPE